MGECQTGDHAIYIDAGKRGHMATSLAEVGMTDMNMSLVILKEGGSHTPDRLPFQSGRRHNMSSSSLAFQKRGQSHSIGPLILQASCRIG